MEISKPIMVSRLVIGRRSQTASQINPGRRLYRSSENAKCRSNNALMWTSMAYLNSTAGNGNLHPAHRHVIFPSRYCSSKPSQTDKSCKKESVSLASSWSVIHHAVESTSMSVQKMVMDRFVAPLLSYSIHVMPKLSERGHKARCEKLEDKELPDDGLRNENVVNPSSDKIVVKDCKVSEVSESDGDRKSSVKDSKMMVMKVGQQEKESVSFWVKMPSLKNVASSSTIADMGTSATRVLRRRKKDKGTLTLTGREQTGTKDCPTAYPPTESKVEPKDADRNAVESPESHSETEAVRFQDQEPAQTVESPSTSEEYLQTVASLRNKLPSISSTYVSAIFKKFGATPSAIAAASPNLNLRKDIESTTASAIPDEEGNAPSAIFEYKSSSHSEDFSKSGEIISLTTEEKTPKSSSNIAHIHNNYNLKYIQVNLFRLPRNLFQTKSKEKPVTLVPPPPHDDSPTTYFDSDVPLLEMAEALNNECASGTAPIQGGTQSAVADKSKRYANVAVKVKEEKETRKSIAEKNQKKSVRPVISKANVEARTKALSISIRTATTTASRVLTMERLCNHLIQYPESCHVAIQERLIPTLLALKQRSRDVALQAKLHQLLAHVGYAPAVGGRGLRILSVDGGGTRGVIPVEVLRELERLSGQRIHEMFDYVIGVSSGAVLVYLLAYAKASLDTCEELFKTMSVEVFKRNTLLGTSKLFFSHAYYDTDAWMKILRDHMQGVGQTPAIEMAQDPLCPKVASVATLMNAGIVKNFLFRNYNHPPNTSSFYQGSSKHQLCEGLRASSAAPGYFEEYKLDDYIFQDGGILTNNPSALGLHESKLLWPDTPIQCVVSLGTGRYDPVGEGVESSEFSSLKKKLYQLMISATDTESVHTTLQDLLPPGSYFRFNPRISEDFLLDENRPEKIDQLQQEAVDFVADNKLRIMQAAGVLTREKSRLQKVADWVKEKRDMYQ